MEKGTFAQGMKKDSGNVIGTLGRGYGEKSQKREKKGTFVEWIEEE